MSAVEPQTSATRQSRSSRALRWTVSITAVSMVVLGLALLYLLLEATNNREYERNYTKLVTINAIAAAALLLAIVWVAWRLYVRWQQGANSAADCWSNWRPSLHCWGWHLGC